MVFKLELFQFFKVSADFICHKTAGCDNEIAPQFRTAMVDIPIRRGQGSLVQLREQGAVVVKDRRHPDDRHCLVVKQEAKVSVVAIRIQGDCIQNTHPPKVAVAAENLAIVQQPGDRLLFTEYSAGLDQAGRFRCEQRAFTHQLIVIQFQIILHRIRADALGQLRYQELRYRFNHMQAAAAFIKPDPVRITYPALGVIAVRAEFRRSRRQIGLADHAVKGGLAHKLVKLVPIQGNAVPAKIAARLFHPEGVIQGQGMGNAEKAFQIIAAVSFQQLLDMLAMFGGLPTREEIAELAISDRSKFCQPFEFRKLRLIKRVAFAGKAEHGQIPVHQYIFSYHASASLRVCCSAEMPIIYGFFCHGISPRTPCQCHDGIWLV